MASEIVAQFNGPYGTVIVKKYYSDSFIDAIVSTVTPSIDYIVETEGGTYEFFSNLEDAIEEAKRLAGIE